MTAESKDALLHVITHTATPRLPPLPYHCILLTRLLHTLPPKHIMTTRKAAAKEEGGNSAKRQRIHVASFDDLNIDTLVNICSFLTVEDMNEVAMVTKGCREARNNKSLDQKRIGIITCSRARHSTTSTLCTVLDAARVAFTAYYTRLKIMGLEKFEDYAFPRGIQRQSTLR